AAFKVPREVVGIIVRDDIEDVVNPPGRRWHHAGSAYGRHSAGPFLRAWMRRVWSLKWLDPCAIRRSCGSSISISLDMKNRLAWTKWDWANRLLVRSEGVFALDSRAPFRRMVIVFSQSKRRTERQPHARKV